MTIPQVSIIVPCYKQAHYLQESLQSVLDQIFDAWECIIVNDGSPDSTENVAQKWCTKDARFKYIKKTNGGLSSARNAGIEISRGEFILPLDADDVLHKALLSTLVPVLETNRDVAVVSCYSKFFDGTLSNIVNELKPKGDSYKHLLYVNQLVATSLYRKSLWKAVGGYDESMKKGFEDWEFWIAITKSGWKYKIIPEYLFYYRKAEKSMLVDTINNHTEIVKQYIITKHKELYIEDFENCVEVFTYHLKVSRAKEKRLQNSIEYKSGKVLLKPFRLLGLLKTKDKG
ncbi:glycosyltransferase family 2 protein [Dokdonia sp. R86516]|uniref:glycosyltransferase family 2 protein n=1 Tax=Dokdonia sp. R86516 TaxID=3093856 RepID=UPI0037C5C320